MSSTVKISQVSNNKKTKQIIRRKDGSHKLLCEDDLLDKDFITPEDVCNLASITQG